MSFAQNLLRLRQQNALTQRQMAERLGVTVSQLRHFETKGGHPSLVVLQTIAGRFAVPLDWLVCERSERQALPEDLRLQFEAIGRLRLDERRAIRALLDDLIRQYMAKRPSRRLAPRPRRRPRSPGARLSRCRTSASAGRTTVRPAGRPRAGARWSSRRSDNRRPPPNC